MSGDLKTIYRASSVFEANLLAAELDAHGIRALVTGDNTNNIAGNLISLFGGALGGSTPWMMSPWVVVAVEDQEKARRIVQEFEETLLNSKEDPEKYAPAVDVVWQDWPACRGCGRRRLTRCPACEETGTDFPLADYHERGEASRTLDEEGNVAVDSGHDSELPFLLCPHCDETFLATFYRRCASCGHDSGGGLEPAATREPLRMQDGAIVYAGVALLGLTALGILAWAWSLRN